MTMREPLNDWDPRDSDHNRGRWLDAAFIVAAVWLLWVFWSYWRPA